MAFDPAEYQRIVDRKRRERMDKIDAMPEDIRELVHEYGSTVVNAFMQNGVTKANRIRHLVETVLDEFSPTRGSFATQGIRNPQINRPKQK
jgi:hypothetical protein